MNTQVEAVNPLRKAIEKTFARVTCVERTRKPE